MRLLCALVLACTIIATVHCVDVTDASRLRRATLLDQLRQRSFDSLQQVGDAAVLPPFVQGGLANGVPPAAVPGVAGANGAVLPGQAIPPNGIANAGGLAGAANGLGSGSVTVQSLGQTQASIQSLGSTTLPQESQVVITPANTKVCHTKQGTKFLCQHADGVCCPDGETCCRAGWTCGEPGTRKCKKPHHAHPHPHHPQPHVQAATKTESVQSLVSSMSSESTEHPKPRIRIIVPPQAVPPPSPPPPPDKSSKITIVSNDNTLVHGPGGAGKGMVDQETQKAIQDALASKSTGSSGGSADKPSQSSSTANESSSKQGSSSALSTQSKTPPESSKSHESSHEHTTHSGLEHGEHSEHSHSSESGHSSHSASGESSHAAESSKHSSESSK